MRHQERWRRNELERNDLVPGWWWWKRSKRGESQVMVMHFPVDLEQ